MLTPLPAYLNLCRGLGQVVASRGSRARGLCEPALDGGLVEVCEGHSLGDRDVLGVDEVGGWVKCECGKG